MIDITGADTGAGASYVAKDVNYEARVSNRKLRNAQTQTGDTSFLYPINPYLTCARNISWQKGGNWDMVVVVVSAISNFIRRDAIRHTWSSTAPAINSKVVFLVGEDKTGRLLSQIEKEAELYGDIIQVDIADDFSNLTFKSIAMLQWLNDYCANSNYYFKVDDDVYANLENILKRLNSTSAQTKRFFLCHVFQNAPTVRNKNSKYYTSEAEYSAKHFPKYCSGTGYTFSGSILSDLYQVSKLSTIIPMEDVFITGIVAKGQEIAHVHDGGFSFVKRKPTGCAFEKALTGHEMTVKQMFIIFAQLQSKEIDCETKINKYLQRVENRRNPG